MNEFDELFFDLLQEDKDFKVTLGAMNDVESETVFFCTKLDINGRSFGTVSDENPTEALKSVLNFTLNEVKNKESLTNIIDKFSEDDFDNMISLLENLRNCKEV